MNEISSIKEAPHSIEAEQQLLGALLTNNDLYTKVSTYLRVEHFYDPVHAKIYKHISGRIAKDHLASPITLKEEMGGDEGLKELGGASYLARMAGAAIAAYALTEYAQMIVRLHGLRALDGKLSDIKGRIGTEETATDLCADLELFLQGQQAQDLNPRSMSLLKAHTGAVMEINERQVSGHVGLTTGLKDLDELTGGFHNGELTLVAGSTSMGKTAMGVWLAYVAAKTSRMVGFATLEMSEFALAQRFASIDSQIPYHALRNILSEATFRKVVEGVKAQEALPIHIYSDRVRDIPSILSESRRLQRMHPPNDDGFKGFGLLVIDYIQQVRGKGPNKLEQLSQVAMDAKQIAKTLNVPVVALAQVNRSLGDRKPERGESQIPKLSDLRGAGDLEFAADNVIFCHRPEYYLERELQQNPQMEVEDRADLEAALGKCKGMMDLIVAKQRMGKIGNCRVRADLGTNRFFDIDQQQEAAF